MIIIEIVKIDRTNQIIYSAQPKLLGQSTKLTASAIDGATSLTVESSSGFNDNDWVLIGKFGQESAETTDLTASPSDDHAITVTAIKHNHPVGTPVSFLRYDRVRFQSATSEDGTYSDAAGVTGTAVQPDKTATTYEHTSMVDSTWYTVLGYDTKNTASSGSSQAVQATGFKTGSLRDIINTARSVTRQPDENFITDDDITALANAGLTSLQSKKGWVSMETQAYGALYKGKSAYSLPSDYKRIKNLKVYDEDSLGTWYAGQWTDATSTYTDDTTDASDTGVDDFPLCTTTVNSGFAVVGSEKFCRVTIRIGVAQVGSPVYVYYYWNGSSWAALTSYIVDTPVYTSVDVSTDLSFVSPTDWRPLPETTTWKDASSNSLYNNYAILMKATTAPTTAPVADYISVYYPNGFVYTEYKTPGELKQLKNTLSQSSETEFPSGISIWGSYYEVYPPPQYNRLTELLYYKEFTRYNEMNDVAELPTHLPILWYACSNIEFKFGELQRADIFERKHQESIEELTREEQKQYDKLLCVRDEDG